MKNLIIIMILLINCNKLISQSSWETQLIPYNKLNKVFFTSINTGWVVGYEMISKTTNGGSNWQLQKSPVSTNLNSAFFINSSTGWIVGGHSNVGGYIFTTTNSGINWKIQDNSSSVPLTSIFFIDSKTGWAGGNSLIMKTTNSGLNWNIYHNNQLTRSMYFINQYTGWSTVGIKETLESAICKSTNGGINWIQQYTVPGELRSIYFKNENTGWAVGSSNSIFKTSDGGKNWIEKKVESSNLFSIHFSQNTGIVGAATGILLKTTDEGNSWTKIQATSEDDRIESVFVLSNVGYAVTLNGKLLNSTNIQTNNWNYKNNFNTNNLSSIKFISNTTGYAIGTSYNSLSKLFYTQNGGINWSYKSLPYDYSFDHLGKIDFDYNNKGIIVGGTSTSSIILTTTNNGVNWVSQKSPASTILYDVDITSSNTAYIVGAEGTILKTTNFGLNWNLIKCPVKEDLNSISFWGITGYGWIAGNSGTILRTTDYGNTWNTQKSGVTSNLKCIKIYDRKYGWAVGMDNTILKTTDGGYNWKKITNSNGNSNYFTINFFKKGLVFVGGNGGIYKTVDDGINWTKDYTISENVTSIVCTSEDSVYASVFSSKTPYIIKTVSGSTSKINIKNTDEQNIISNFSLFQNYPNPFNPTTSISFELPNNANVSIKIYDAAGKEINSLINEYKHAGKHSINFNANNLSSGIYFYKINITNENGLIYSNVKKMTLIK